MGAVKKNSTTILTVKPKIIFLAFFFFFFVLLQKHKRKIGFLFTVVDFGVYCRLRSFDRR